MGTVFSIDVRDKMVDSSVLEAVLERLHDIDDRYTTYRSGSTISRLRDRQLALADAPAEVPWLLDQCRRWRDRTQGWFDVRASGELDPSGYVKGWAIAQASEMLSAAGSHRHCVNGGGDILAIGAPSDEPWTFGIADPADSTRLLATVQGTSLAVATSGISERGAHVIDPRTRAKVSGATLSFTVVGRSIIECDVLATAGLAMGSAAETWFASYPGVQTFGFRYDGDTFSTRTTTPRQEASNPWHEPHARPQTWIAAVMPSPSS